MKSNDKSFKATQHVLEGEIFPVVAFIINFHHFAASATILDLETADRDLIAG